MRPSKKLWWLTYLPRRIWTKICWSWSLEIGTRKSYNKESPRTWESHKIFLARNNAIRIRHNKKLLWFHATKLGKSCVGNVDSTSVMNTGKRWSTFYDTVRHLSTNGCANLRKAIMKHSDILKVAFQEILRLMKSLRIKWVVYNNRG